MKHFRKIKFIGFFLWHAKHMVIHLALGLLWAWVLRELWNELNFRWILLALLGSWLPDIEHLFYWLTYGKKDMYTLQIFSFLKTKQWREVIKFIQKGHKSNTNLAYRNIYFVLILCILTIVCLVFDWKSWIVLIGAMIFRYLFDISEDIILLGRPNPNWKRWGRGKKNYEL